MKWLRIILQLPSAALIGMVRLYQIFLSPFLGGQCRFQPTCSHYFIEAVKKYGAISGSFRGIRRILRCHPYHPGGYDPP
jgi:putative membrane protein insertion efficiency factor